MDNIKIVFFDIDGTLIDMKRKRISEKTLETLIHLKEKNIILGVATGRSPLGLPQFNEIEFDVFLTFNGSYCFNKQEVIFSNPIPINDIKKIISNAKSMNRPVSIATKERLISNGKDKDLVEYHSFANLEVIIADDFDDVLINHDIYQVLAGCHKNDYPKLMKNICNAKITAWWDRAVDIIPTSSSKGIGIDKILKYYHLDKSEALAFGDGNNDIEMLQAVGKGIAMGNASEELKSVADDICGNVENDGIYYYCMEHRVI
ncbi:MAG: Cof-type HAD-IIB family hydrolase [Clostridium sp.]|nr:Cof-type HAD-IIB family hydrolase [Clostridium sp.]